MSSPLYSGPKRREEEKRSTPIKGKKKMQYIKSYKISKSWVAKTKKQKIKMNCYGM